MKNVDAKLIGAITLLTLALTLLDFVLFGYWLLSSWLVDSVIKMEGAGAMLIKIILVLFFCSVVQRINYRSKH